MGRRKTAKTGDKALYKARSSHPKIDELRPEDDEFMPLGNSSDDSVGEDDSAGSNIPVMQNVMDLGLEEESDSSYDSRSEDEDPEILHGGGNEESENSSVGSSSEMDDTPLEHNTNTSRWGKKKSLYYHGDTADIEIGQNKEDAFDEEEAAKDIESSRFQVMDDEDFMQEDSDDEGGEVDKTTCPDENADITMTRDLSTLSTKEKRRFVKKQHPELLPLVAFFSDVCRECRDTTNATKALLNRSVDVIKSVGATKEGQQYLLTKSILGNSVALNAAIYLLLKQDMGVKKFATGIQSHPVMVQLQKCMVLADALKQDVASSTDSVENQISSLVQAIEIMNGDCTKNASGAFRSDSDKEEPVLSDGSTSNESLCYQGIDQHVLGTDDILQTAVAEKRIETEDSLMNEAKFGLRTFEIETNSKKVVKRRKESTENYFGDLNNKEIQHKKNFLASTINTLEQRAKKQRPRTQVEEIDETEAIGALSQGLSMMEEELRITSDVNEGKMIYDAEENYLPNTDDPQNARDFYSAIAKRSKERKAIKQKLYQVQPKLPGIVSEVSGERAISRVMMKNRGLVAHKSKINRNPRVKKREQYRKALIRRKGAVREIRTNEGHKYGGEETGIKRGISRSRKL